MPLAAPVDIRQPGKPITVSNTLSGTAAARFQEKHVRKNFKLLSEEFCGSAQ